MFSILLMYRLVVEQVLGRRTSLRSHCEIVKSKLLLEGSASTTLQGSSNLNQEQDGSKGTEYCTVSRRRHSRRFGTGSLR